MRGNDRIQIELEPYRAARLSSNSVRILAPRRMVVVDAGGEAVLFRRHVEAIAAAQPTPPLPVCLAQTHVHIDHIAGLLEHGPLPTEWSCELAMHELGWKMLRETDRVSTLAELTGRELAAMDWADWRVMEIRPEAGRSPTEPDGRIPLDDDVDLEAYCTPGHSPDSVVWRVGRILFAGDLLAATAPLVAGIPGWNRDALLNSLQRLETLIDVYGIRQVHVGHGRPLDRAATRQAMARSRSEAERLGCIAPVNRARIQQTAAQVEGLTEELEELFGDMAQRLSRLADRLSQIQENRMADEVRDLDRSREARELLGAFDRFKAEAQTQGHSLLSVASKGIQTVQCISKLLAWERLDWVIDESFLRFVRTRVVDFIQAAKGLEPSAELQSVDLSGWLGGWAAHLRAQQGGGCPLEGIEGGEEGLRRQLAYCLARTPSLGTATLQVDAGDVPLPVRLDPARFSDALVRLVERRIQRGARQVFLRVVNRGSFAHLEFWTPGIGATRGTRIAAWENVFSRAGTQATFPPPGADAPVLFRMPMELPLSETGHSEPAGDL